MSNPVKVFEGDELLHMPAHHLATIIGSDQITCKEEQVVLMSSYCQDKNLSKVWIALQTWASKGGLDRRVCQITICN